MRIVQLSGGLGNQMFEYALYLRLQAEGYEVKIDDATCYQAAGTRPKQLDIFGVQYEAASKEEIEKMTDSSMKLYHRARRFLCGRRNLSYRERDVNFDPEVLQRDPVLLEGCFQSEQYFAPAAKQVREAFRFRNLKLSREAETYLLQMETTPSVSVHIRRGDYLAAETNGIYAGICDAAYYERAFARVKEAVPDAVFYLFTNDPDWVRANMAGKDRILVEGNGEAAGYVDLFLMSRCSHNIIANSSFSWWGAWLNRNPHKIIIAPAKWLNGRDCRDIYTEDMITL